MSNETKFFDVECASSTYDLKELRRLFKKVFGKRAANLEVYNFQRGIRLRVEEHTYVSIDFAAIQREILDPLVISLHDPLADPVEESLVEIVTSPIDIPVTIVTTAIDTTQIAVSPRAPLRLQVPTRRGPEAA